MENQSGLHQSKGKRTVKVADDKADARKWIDEHDDPWKPMILCLDGGGIRGYATLLILKRLMRYISHFERKEERAAEERRRQSLSNSSSTAIGRGGEDFHAPSLLPCHYFDYIYGTSTGGLIAIMLGRLRMSVPECLEQYQRIGDFVFGHTRNPIPGGHKFSHISMETEVPEVVKSYCKAHTGEEPLPKCAGDDHFAWAPNKSSIAENLVETDYHICQAVCLTVRSDYGNLKAVELRTYDVSRDEPVAQSIPMDMIEASNLTITQVARATSAAPLYFKPLEVNGTIYKDGGIRENNPTFLALNGCRRRYGGEEPDLLLSIGTGLPRRYVKKLNKGRESQSWMAHSWKAVSEKPRDLYQMAKDVKNQYTDCEKTHQIYRVYANGLSTWYKRFNADTGVADISLGEWKSSSKKKDGKKEKIPGGETLSKMEAGTKEYLNRKYDEFLDRESYDAPKEMLKDCAEKLVKRRRARELAISEEKVRRRAETRDQLTRPAEATLGKQVSAEDAATLETMTNEGAQTNPLKEVSEKRWDTYLGRYLTLELDPHQQRLVRRDKDKPKKYEPPVSSRSSATSTAGTTSSASRASTDRSDALLLPGGAQNSPSTLRRWIPFGSF